MPSIIKRAEHHGDADGDCQLGSGQAERLARRRALPDIDSTISAEADQQRAAHADLHLASIESGHDARAEKCAEHRRADDADQRQ